MNGYEIMAESYRDYLKEHPGTPEAEAVQDKIKAYSYLAGASDRERLELFNSSAFNNVCKGYFLKAMDNRGIDQETRRNLLKEISVLFDEMTAAEAELYYLNN